MVHLVAFQQDGLDDIVAHDLEVGFADVMLDVLLGAGEEVVQAQDVIAAGHQEVDQVRPDEAGAARHHHAIDAADAGAGLGFDQGVAVFVHRARCGEGHERAGWCGGEDDVADEIPGARQNHDTTFMGMRNRQTFRVSAFFPTAPRDDENESVGMNTVRTNALSEHRSRAAYGTMRNTRAVWSSDAVTMDLKSGDGAKSRTPRTCPCCTA